MAERYFKTSAGKEVGFSKLGDADWVFRLRNHLTETNDTGGLTDFNTELKRFQEYHVSPDGKRQFEADYKRLELGQAAERAKPEQKERAVEELGKVNEGAISQKAKVKMQNTKLEREQKEPPKEFPGIVTPKRPEVVKDVIPKPGQAIESEARIRERERTYQSVKEKYPEATVRELEEGLVLPKSAAAGLPPTAEPGRIPEPTDDYQKRVTQRLEQLGVDPRDYAVVKAKAAERESGAQAIQLVAYVGMMGVTGYQGVKGLMFAIRQNKSYPVRALLETNGAVRQAGVTTKGKPAGHIWVAPKGWGVSAGTKVAEEAPNGVFKLVDPSGSTIWQGANITPKVLSGVVAQLPTVPPAEATPPTVPSTPPVMPSPVAPIPSASNVPIYARGPRMSHTDWQTNTVKKQLMLDIAASPEKSLPYAAVEAAVGADGYKQMVGVGVLERAGNAVILGKQGENLLGHIVSQKKMYDKMEAGVTAADQAELELEKPPTLQAEPSEEPQMTQITQTESSVKEPWQMTTRGSRHPVGTPKLFSSSDQEALYLSKKVEEGYFLHGTPTMFEGFEEGGIGTAAGHFFTASPDVARFYADADGIILVVKLNVPNDKVANLLIPDNFNKVFDAGFGGYGDEDVMRKQVLEAMEFGELYNRSMGDWQNTLVRAAENLGYKVIVFPDNTSGMIDNSIVVFDPQDIQITEAVTLSTKLGVPSPQPSPVGEGARPTTEAEAIAQTEPSVKEPWQMTRAEYHEQIGYSYPSNVREPYNQELTRLYGEDKTKWPTVGDAENWFYDDPHRAQVKQAIREGKAIPPEVMEDYIKPGVKEDVTVSQVVKEAQPVQPGAQAGAPPVERQDSLSDTQVPRAPETEPSVIPTPQPEVDLSTRIEGWKMQADKTALKTFDAAVSELYDSGLTFEQAEVVAYRRATGEVKKVLTKDVAFEMAAAGRAAQTKYNAELNGLVDAGVPDVVAEAAAFEHAAGLKVSDLGIPDADGFYHYVPKHQPPWIKSWNVTDWETALDGSKIWHKQDGTFLVKGVGEPFRGFATRAECVSHITERRAYLEARGEIEKVVKTPHELADGEQVIYGMGRMVKLTEEHFGKKWNQLTTEELKEFAGIVQAETESYTRVADIRAQVEQMQTQPMIKEGEEREIGSYYVNAMAKAIAGKGRIDELTAADWEQVLEKMPKALSQLQRLGTLSEAFVKKHKTGEEVAMGWSRTVRLVKAMSGEESLVDFVVGDDIEAVFHEAAFVRPMLVSDKEELAWDAARRMIDTGTIDPDAVKAAESLDIYAFGKEGTPPTAEDWGNAIMDFLRSKSQYPFGRGLPEWLDVPEGFELDVLRKLGNQPGGVDRWINAELKPGFMAGKTLAAPALRVFIDAGIGEMIVEREKVNAHIGWAYRDALEGYKGAVTDLRKAVGRKAADAFIENGGMNVLKLEEATPEMLAEPYRKFATETDKWYEWVTQKGDEVRETMGEQPIKRRAQYFGMNLIDDIVRENVLDIKYGIPPDVAYAIKAGNIPLDIKDKSSYHRWMKKHGLVKDYTRVFNSTMMHKVKYAYLKPYVEKYKQKIALVRDEVTRKWLMDFLRFNIVGQPTDVDMQIEKGMKQGLSGKVVEGVAKFIEWVGGEKGAQAAARFRRNPAKKITRTALSMIYTGTMGFNMPLGPRNAVQIFQNMSTLGPIDWAAGVGGLANKWGRAIARKFNILAVGREPMPFMDNTGLNLSKFTSASTAHHRLADKNSVRHGFLGSLHGSVRQNPELKELVKNHPSGGTFWKKLYHAMEENPELFGVGTEGAYDPIGKAMVDTAVPEYLYRKYGQSRISRGTFGKIFTQYKSWPLNFYCSFLPDGIQRVFTGKDPHTGAKLSWDKRFGLLFYLAAMWGFNKAAKELGWDLQKSTILGAFSPGMAPWIGVFEDLWSLAYYSVQTGDEYAKYKASKAKRSLGRSMLMLIPFYAAYRRVERFATGEDPRLGQIFFHTVRRPGEQVGSVFKGWPTVEPGWLKKYDRLTETERQSFVALRLTLEETDDLNYLAKSIEDGQHENWGRKERAKAARIGLKFEKYVEEVDKQNQGYVKDARVAMRGGHPDAALELLKRAGYKGKALEEKFDEEQRYYLKPSLWQKAEEFASTAIPSFEQPEPQAGVVSAKPARPQYGGLSEGVKHILEKVAPNDYNSNVWAESKRQSLKDGGAGEYQINQFNENLLTARAYAAHN